MGTNYYCETGRMLEVECDCGFTHMMPETLHIGKSSFGWRFTLHSIPEKGLTEWRRWEELLSGDGVRIFDEYGNVVGFGELRSTVLERGNRSVNGLTKERMRETARRYGYVLDEEKWLYCGEPGRRLGSDGDYTLVEGEFS